MINTLQPSNLNAQVGSTQLLTNGGFGGFAIFKYTPTGQEAAFPLETRNAPSYVLAFDNIGALGTGVAIDPDGARALNRWNLRLNRDTAVLATD